VETPENLTEHDLRVERVRNLSALEALSPEWAELDAAMSPRTPFSSPTWNVLWWHHFAERRTTVRDEFFVHVARDRRNGRLVAIFPLLRARRPGRGVAAVRSVQFFGTDANLTEMRGVVCRPEHERPALTALALYLYSRPGELDWFHCHGVREDSMWDGIARGRAVLKERKIPDYYLELPETWEALKSGLPRNIKESLRKCYNSLKRDGHAFTFRVVEKPEEAAGAIDRFLALHSARAQATGTTQHADVFSGEKPRAFLHECARQMAVEGKLRVFQLDIAGSIVATRVGFLLGDQLYLYFSGYDEAWGKYSVMTTTVAEAIKWAIEQRLRIVNLSPGADVSKQRWAPKEQTFRDGIVLSPTHRARLVFKAFEYAKERPTGRLGSFVLGLVGRKR
jgi:CelD/BcsL family acetyltransferase involved in cellulose biosynthesis